MPPIRCGATCAGATRATCPARARASTIVGSGYVVESLEAALWCFARHDTFESAILAAANLGHDADTTAAICGQLAGAHHGLGGIPDHRVERVAMRESIVALADALAR